MAIFKTLGVWCVTLQSIALLAIGMPGLLAGRWVVLVAFLGGAFGIIGTAFAKQMFGKSDSARLADGMPQDRATDPAIKAP